MMETAQDGHRYDPAHMLDGAMDRRILVERLMRPQLIIDSKQHILSDSDADMPRP